MIQRMKTRIAIGVLCVVCFFLGAAVMNTQRVRATGGRVYVERVKVGKWNDLQGDQILGFACGPMPSSNGTSSGADCFVASK